MFRLPHEEVPRCRGSSCARNQADTHNGGQGTSWRAPRLNNGGGVGPPPLDSDRGPGVLGPGDAARLVSPNDFVVDLVVDACRDEDVSRIGNSFKPRCNVDAITIDVFRFDDDVSEIHSDPILYPLVTCERRITPHNALLNDDGAADSF